MLIRTSFDNFLCQIVAKGVLHELHETTDRAGKDNPKYFRVIISRDELLEEAASALILGKHCWVINQANELLSREYFATF